jgi:hypothetical protein
MEYTSKSTAPRKPWPSPKIGMDVVLEALKLYKTRKKFNLGELLKYAKICRVEKVMRPYLEATV